MVKFPLPLCELPTETYSLALLGDCQLSDGEWKDTCGHTRDTKDFGDDTWVNMNQNLGHRGYGVGLVVFLKYLQIEDSNRLILDGAHQLEQWQPSQSLYHIVNVGRLQGFGLHVPFTDESMSRNDLLVLL